MTEELSLRERKKIETGRVIWTKAVDLFLERGYDAVSVKEIAEAVNLSKMTVFNYFPSKEDLVMHPIAEHVDEPMRVVRDRLPGVTPHGAFRAHFIAALKTFDAATGLNNHTYVREIQQLIRNTPALTMRMLALNATAEELLAAHLVTEGVERTLAELVAAQILATRNTLISLNHRRVPPGVDPADVLPQALADADQAFDLLESGLGDRFAKR